MPCLDDNHIMHKIVINARIVKTKHTLLASTVWFKWTMKLYKVHKCKSGSLWLMELGKLPNWVYYLTEYRYCMSKAVSHLLIAKHVTESIV